MIVGSVCLSTPQGLGYLTRDFFRNGLIDEVLIQSHGTKQDNPEWFEKKKCDLTIRTNWPYSVDLAIEEKDVVSNFLNKIDLLLVFETYFNLEIISMAKKKNVKIVYFPMYEITPYPVYADAFCATSDLDYDYYTKLYAGKTKVKRLNIPVPKEISWKKRETAKVFIHNTGNGGTFGRNGTQELLNSLQFVKSPIKLIVRSQSLTFKSDDPRVEIVSESVPFEKLWTEGDVFIFPEKFNGLSLPIQEAFSSGMSIMCGNRFPMNNWLPQELLIPIDHYETKNITNVKFKSAIFSEKNIAKTIDLWYNKDISTFSELGKDWGERNSWGNLIPQYRNFFGEVLNG